MSKRFKDLIPGNSLYLLCLNPENDEIFDIINCIVDRINETKTVIGVSYVNREDKSTMLLDFFRVDPESFIDDGFKNNKEHRMKVLFESKTSAIDNYIHYCEEKIQNYKENINKTNKLV